MRLQLATTLLVQFVLVALGSTTSSATSSSSLARVPSYTQVQNRHCRFGYSIANTMNQCFAPYCRMNSNVFREADLVQPLPQQRPVCILEVPSQAYLLILSAPLERIDLVSPNCTSDFLKHHTSISKILANGSRIIITEQSTLYELSVTSGNPSDLWCESPNLNPIPDPDAGQCSVVVTIPVLHPRYAGSWQMIVSLPTAPATAMTSGEASAKPATANAVNELDSVHEFYFKFIDPPCEACFGKQSKCAKLSFNDFYLDGKVSLEAQVKRPTYNVFPGNSFCAVLESATGRERDVKGSWLFASNSTSMTAEPLLYFDVRSDGTMVSVNTMNGVSLYGKYQHCLHIDQMTDALDGLFMYQHSSDYAGAHNTSSLAIIRVQVDVGVLDTPEESRANAYAVFGTLHGVLLATILALALRTYYAFKDVEKQLKNKPGYISVDDSESQGGGSGEDKRMLDAGGARS